MPIKLHCRCISSFALSGLASGMRNAGVCALFNAIASSESIKMTAAECDSDSMKTTTVNCIMTARLMQSESDGIVYKSIACHYNSRSHRSGVLRFARHAHPSVNVCMFAVFWNGYILLHFGCVRKVLMQNAKCAQWIT